MIFVEFKVKMVLYSGLHNFIGGFVRLFFAGKYIFLKKVLVNKIFALSLQSQSKRNDARS
jgi:hypothetical protein